MAGLLLEMVRQFSAANRRDEQGIDAPPFGRNPTGPDATGDHQTVRRIRPRAVRVRQN